MNRRSIAIGDLTHRFWRLDPSHADTKTVLAQIKGVVNDIPAHRLSAPSIQTAGTVTGVAARLCDLPKVDRQPS